MFTSVICSFLFLFMPLPCRAHVPLAFVLISNIELGLHCTFVGPLSYCPSQAPLSDSINFTLQILVSAFSKPFFMEEHSSFYNAIIFLKMIPRHLLLSFSLFMTFWGFSQESYTTSTDTGTSTEEFVYKGPIGDHSKEGQMAFVLNLLDLAGYVIDRIEVYQTLPNHARLFRVRFDDDTNGGFIFIRWDKKKMENFVDNKRIDPGLYYNLKAAKEIMRQQTDLLSFGVEDGALQAPDQEKISPEDLEGLRQQYDLDQEEKKLRELEKANKSRKRRKQN